MGYQTSIYTVDLRQLRSALGSKDAELLRRITETYRDEFDASNETFADQIAEGALTLDAALAEVIQGTCSGSASTAFQYGYALEMLCRHLGAQLETDMLGEIVGIGFAEQLATSGPPIPIPTPDDEFPVIGYLTHHQADADQPS